LFSFSTENPTQKKARKIFNEHQHGGGGKGKKTAGGLIFPMCLTQKQKLSSSNRLIGVNVNESVCVCVCLMEMRNGNE